MKILILILISVNIVLAQKAMFEPIDAESLSKLYQEVDGKNWQFNGWEDISKDKIYLSPNDMTFVGITTEKNRDTTINDETIEIYTVIKLDLGKAIGKPKINNERIQGGNIPFLTFNSLEEFYISKLNGTFGVENISFPNLKVLNILDCEMYGTLNLNSMPKLENVDFYKALINIDLNDLNLPNCKKFNLIGTKVKSKLTIKNLLNVESFQIREWFENEWDYQEPGEFSLYGSNIKEIKKLINAKHIAICYAAIGGKLDTLNIPNLEKLELYANGINGSFPIITSPNITYIDMQGNSLTQVPEILSHSKLEYLNLSVNGLNGNLPQFDTPNLIHLNLSRNSFNSGLNASLFTNIIQFIDLSSNKFNQEINLEIKCSNLECLKLMNNKFVGNIPKIKCDKMFYLGLVDNQFSNFTNELNVNKGTVIEVFKNNLLIWDIAERCENFPLSERKVINVNTTPKHIIDYYILSDIEKFMEYTGLDLGKEGINENSYHLRRLHILNFDNDMNRLVPFITDTNNYNYEVIYFQNDSPISLNKSINDPLEKLGKYQLKITSKYCDIQAYTEIIEINQLSVINPKEISVYKANDFIQIDNSNDLLISNVQVIDLLGNIIYQSNESFKESKRINLNINRQPLFIKIYSNNEWIVKKVI